jgi:hypothetical protein
MATPVGLPAMTSDQQQMMQNIAILPLIPIISLNQLMTQGMQQNNQGVMII